MKNLFRIVGVIFAVCIILGVILTNSDDTSTKKNSASQTAQTEENNDENKGNPEEKADPNLLYSDENYTITYKKLKGTPGITMAMLQLKLENNSDKNAFITLSEGYVNDTAITFLGGNMTFDGISPQKSGICTFSFGYDGILESFDDIEKLEFKIQISDPDNISTKLLQTNTITIYPN